MVVTRVKIRSLIGPIAVGALLFLQIFSPARAVLFLLLIISGVLAVSYYWARELGRGLQLARFRRYGWAQVGDIIEERFVLRNNGIMPAIWVDVRDHSDLPGYSVSRATGVGARGTTRWTTEGSCSQRGIYTLGPMELHTSDPFGLFDVTLEHQYSERFVVYPPLAAIPRLFEPRGTSRGSARTNIRTLDLTTNAGGVRQYVPGDALNRIHWRTTARRSTPNDEEFFVKEFDLEPSGDLWIIVDMDAQAHAGQGAESTEEYAVILAASLANEMLLANHAVGLFTHTDGPLVVPPKKGHQQLWEILRVLAGLHAESSVSLDGMLSLFEPIAGRGMSAAVITPSPSSNWLSGLAGVLRHGLHMHALLLDRASFGGKGNVDGVFQALADLGVAGHIIARGFPFAFLTQKRRQRPTYRTLGTGRVVVVDKGREEQADWVAVSARNQSDGT
jgi:uncharacterized protein (DUF58 family)